MACYGESTNVHSSQTSMALSCEKTSVGKKESRQRNYILPLPKVMTASNGHDLPEQHFRPVTETEDNHVANLLYTVNNGSGGV
jgi:hypothetical protein